MLRASIQSMTALFLPEAMLQYLNRPAITGILCLINAEQQINNLVPTIVGISYFFNTGVILCDQAPTIAGIYISF